MKKAELENLQNLFFLGPKGEQRKFFQEMIELINNDIIFWRRNFHPKDPPVIPYRNLTSPIGQDYQENFIQSLVQLLAELKMDIPFFSPRYMAHMTADVSLPGLLGYYAGLLYNANNVSGEASPVTLRYELEVGKQFARLFEYNDKESFGHITSGGTVANFESVFYNKAARFIPATLGMILKQKNLPWPSFLPKDLWKLLNLKLCEIPSLLNEFRDLDLDLEKSIQANSPAYLGDREYWHQLQSTFKTTIGQPVIIVPATAHYSWSKASHLFGMGKVNCLQVKIDSNLAMSSAEFGEVLNYCQNEKRPIIQTVCVLGSTEFGSFDPLDEILNILKEREESIYSPVHIDAAYGGYFKAMFVPGPRYAEFAHEAGLKNARLQEIFSCVKDTDSITVDPHKLGHTPYGAGLFLTKHGFSKEFIAEEADYCLTSQEANDEDFPLGKYILEGSKSGASATSVYFSNKIIPLNSDGYGGLLQDLISKTNEFYDLLNRSNMDDREFSAEMEIIPVSLPQSNLLCFYLKPKSMKSMAKINDFNLKILHNYFPHPTDHIQDFSYFISKTKLKVDKITDSEKSKIFSDLVIDSDALQLLRIVLLNRWSHVPSGNGLDYMTDFLNRIKSKSLEYHRESQKKT
ncbi:MAG: pyridoxal-dependent decarboxylase [Bacteriovoracaceae bacterium]|nr:pyridoxal-dependent decarboxylase [Bacteriovoracaceae bacterium]